MAIIQREGVSPGAAQLTSPEFQLLTYSVRSRTEARLVRNLVSTGIDWRRLMNLAARNCVRPLLLQGLKSCCWDDVPQGIQRELTTLYRANAQRNLFFTGELLRLVSLFHQHNIAVAAFKGPVLAYSLYGDVSLREFSDLDLLIQEADLCKAEDILRAQGYEADYADSGFRSAFLMYQGQYAFRHPQQKISVDLHWRLSNVGVAFPLQLSEVWSRLEHVTIAGRTVPTLARDDVALLLAAHGTKEGWKSLIWVCDFARALSNYPHADWISILDRAQRARCSRSLLLATALAFKLLDAPAPRALVDKAWASAAVRALVEKARHRMFDSAPEGELQEFWHSLNTHDRLIQRIWPVLTLLTTRTVGDFQAAPLPKSLWGLYYLTRPFRLTGKALKIAGRQVSPILGCSGSLKRETESF